MKKAVSILLAAAMICTMAFVMTSCGEEDVSSKAPISQAAGDTDKTDLPGTSGKDSIFPKALENVEAIPLPDIAYTGWQLSGGMINGKEMEKTDVQSILDACGGKFYFIFPEEGVAMIENGNQDIRGTYEIIEDNYAVHAVFEGYEYYAVFTKVDDVTVMVLVNKAESETALYLTPFEEG